MAHPFNPESCKLCKGTGVYKEYHCVRCGGYQTLMISMVDRIVNPPDITEEEIAQLAYERMTGEKAQMIDVTTMQDSERVMMPRRRAIHA